MAAKPASSNSTVAILLLVAVLFGIGKCAGNDEGATSATNGPPTMPDLVGMTEQKAERLFDEWMFDGPGQDLDIYDWDGVDLSPFDRYSTERWVVVATTPKAGAGFRDGESPRFFALRSAELSWFRKHGRMPRVPVGQPSGAVVGREGALSGVRGLVEFRYASQRVPRSQRGWDVYRAERDVRPDLRVEPSAERRRHSYEEAYGPSSDLVIVGSIPPSGSKLRIGQIVTVLVKEKPNPPSGGGSSYDPDFDVYIDGDDDDDDFNVPGWACPTRFC